MFNIKTLNSISSVYKQYLPKTEYQVGSDVENPDAIIVRSADMHKLELPESVVCIARAGAGVNNIPCEACAEKGVVVFNTPGANANAVKELAVAALLLSSRNIVGGIDWVKGLKDNGADVPKFVEKGKNQFVGPEISGKKLGVIGLGEIGVLVANAGKGLDMQVTGYDPYISVDHAWMLSRSIGKVKQLPDLLSKSDYVTLHLPLIDQTRGMFNKETLSHMKRGATLINLSRGELVVTADIIEALEAGQLRAYVTDFPTAELIGVKGVTLIPHLGASTPESEDNCVAMASRQVANYLLGGEIKNSVNYPNCALPELAENHHRICVLHQNVTGVVGQITALVAELGINIDNMVNKSRGQFAYTVLDLEQNAGDRVIASIESMEVVYRVRCF